MVERQRAARIGVARERDEADRVVGAAVEAAAAEHELLEHALHRVEARRARWSFSDRSSARIEPETSTAIMIAMPSRRTREFLSPARGPVSAIASATTASASSASGSHASARAPGLRRRRAARAATRTRRDPPRDATSTARAARASAQRGTTGARSLRCTRSVRASRGLLRAARAAACPRRTRARRRASSIDSSASGR